MDGVVLDDTELIELLALGDKPLLVRHGCCYVIAGGGGGAQICLSLYSNQSAEWSEESDGERKSWRAFGDPMRFVLFYDRQSSWSGGSVEIYRTL